MAVFGQDPEIFLEQEGIVPYDVVDPSRHAVLDPGLRTFVNYEVFFFANDTTKAAFESNPAAYCGSITDPVTQHRFRPAPGAEPIVYMMRPYYFESAASRTKFEAQPDSFAVRKGM